MSKKRFTGVIRWCVWLVLTLLAVTGLVAAAVWNRPVTAQWVHERVMRRIESAAGVPVKYGSARLHLAQGLYEIDNLQFLNPQQPDEALLSVRNIHLSLKPLSLLMGRP